MMKTLDKINKIRIKVRIYDPYDERRKFNVFIRDTEFKDLTEVQKKIEDVFKDEDNKGT